MPIYYFEIIDERKGWLRIEAPSLDAANEEVEKNGFDAPGIVGSESHREVQVTDGGEERD